MGAKWNYTLLALLAFVFTKAQVNLVQNGSFEQISHCPNQTEPVATAIGWFRPTKGTSDLFNNCDTSSSGGGIVNYFGTQYPQEGNGYAGAFIFINHGIYEAREYVAKRLVSNLKPNHFYCFSMYVSPAENFYYPVSSIGAYFSADSIYVDSYNPMPYIPQIENQEDAFITDTLNWQLISGYFKASGAERYIYIGNFRNNINTIVQIPTNDNVDTYIYIDNIELYECDSLMGIDEQAVKPIKIYPNPAQDFVSIELPPNYPKAQLSIYNLTGQLISQKQLTQSNQTIPIPELIAGMYIFVVQNGAEVIGRQWVVVAR